MGLRTLTEQSLFLTQNLRKHKKGNVAAAVFLFRDDIKGAVCRFCIISTVRKQSATELIFCFLLRSVTTVQRRQHVPTGPP